MKRAIQALGENEGMLRAVINTAVDAIIIIDSHARVQLVNPACESLFGYPAEEVIGENVKMLMPSPYRDEHDAYVQRYRDTGDKRIIGIGRDVIGRRKDGREFPIHLSVGEFDQGDEPYFVGIIHDITERIASEEALRHAQKLEAVGQLSGGIAHDFNNLLTVILGNLEILEGRLEEPRALKPVQRAREAAELGAQLTNRLLAFARRQALEPRVVDLNHLVLGLSDMLHRTLGETVQVSTILGSGLGQTRADPGAIENALLNLAINARDAMPDGGNLTVETRNADLDANSLAGEMDIVPGSYVVLTVTDTGIGMAPEVRDRALEPFFTTKEIGAGTGLGLSMIYGFAKQSGGYLRIYSEPGQGTTVSLYLPRIDEVERIIDKPILPESQVGIAVERILVVEDDPRVREITVIRLEELGYTTLEADRGSAALEILKDNPSIDLLFTDLVMPGGMTGLDLADEARGLRPGLRVLFTTGYAEGAAICGPADSEASHLLRKPYSKQELAEKLRQVLGT